MNRLFHRLLRVTLAALVGLGCAAIELAARLERAAVRHRGRCFGSIHVKRISAASSRVAFALGLGIAVTAGLHAQLSWTARNASVNSGDTLRDVTDGPCGAVAVGDHGTILQSMDGRTWTQRTSGTTDALSAVTYGEHRYVAISRSGLILTSADALIWHPVAVDGVPPGINRVLFAQGRFVAVGESGAALISLDGGDTWKAVLTNAGSAALRGLAFGDGRWLATGQRGTIISSPDGVTWTKQNSSTTQDLDAVAFAESCASLSPSGATKVLYFLAVGANATTQICSLTINLPANSALPTTTTWSTYSTARPATTARLLNLAIANNAFLAVGDDGAAYSAPSYYGPWSKLAIASEHAVVSAGSALGSFLLVGENRTILQSAPMSDAPAVRPAPSQSTAALATPSS